MPPLDLKDWWLAAATATGMLASPAGFAAVNGDRVGVASDVRPSIRSISGNRVIYAGNNILHGERLETDSTGGLHVLFLDQSSITLGPNSVVTIDQYNYIPDKAEGFIQINMIKGFLRVVGGLLSKHTDTRVITRTSTIGVRGGITIVEANDDMVRGIFLFGQHMQMSTLTGQNAETILRPGFSIVNDAQGLSAPIQVPVEEFVSLLNQFESPLGTQATGQVFMPSGKLLSVQEQENGIDAPARTVAPDRLDKVLDDLNNFDPDTSMQRVLGSELNTVQS